MPVSFLATAAATYIASTQNPTAMRTHCSAADGAIFDKQKPGMNSWMKDCIMKGPPDAKDYKDHCN